MKDKLYCVRANRYLHLPQGNTVEVWAGPGDYVKADHPLLHGWIEGQEHKLTPVARLPKGASLANTLPRNIINLMAKYDRETRASGGSAANVDVDGPISELQDKVSKLTATVARLTAENEKLKKSNEQTTRTASSHG